MGDILPESYDPSLFPYVDAPPGAVDDIYTTTPDGGIHLNFHPGQWKAWNSPHRFIGVFAGSQGGKTSWGPWWLHREIEKKGPGDYLAVTSTYDLFKLKMLPSLRHVFEDVTGDGRYWPAGRVIEIKDPVTGKFWARRADDRMYARIILRSADTGGGLESSTAKAAWLDEAGMDRFTRETWWAVLRRLSLSMGRALLSTTLYNFGWIKTEFYDRWKRGEKDYAVINFDSTENPAFPREEWERARATMPGPAFLRMHIGGVRAAVRAHLRFVPRRLRPRRPPRTADGAADLLAPVRRRGLRRREHGGGVPGGGTDLRPVRRLPGLPRRRPDVEGARRIAPGRGAGPRVTGDGRMARRPEGHVCKEFRATGGLTNHAPAVDGTWRTASAGNYAEALRLDNIYHDGSSGGPPWRTHRVLPEARAGRPADRRHRKQVPLPPARRAPVYLRLVDEPEPLRLRRQPHRTVPGQGTRPGREEAMKRTPMAAVL